MGGFSSKSRCSADPLRTCGVAMKGDGHEKARIRQVRGIRAIWSGTPGSNRRPSPWQGPDEDVHGDAARINPAEFLAPPCPSGEAVVSAEAAGCSPFTDAGLTRSERSLPPSIAAIPDDRCSPLG